MPAPRKPLQLLKVSGGYRPSRHAGRNDPDSGPLGDAPGHLTAQQRDIWAEVVGRVAAGVFQASDRIFLEMLARNVAEFRDIARTGPQA